MEVMFIFRKLEGYMHSGIDSRSVPVDRLAGWQAGRQNVVSFRFFKILYWTNVAAFGLFEQRYSIVRAVVIALR